MRRCIKKLASLITAIVAIALAVSCDKEYDFGFKDLCYYHPHTAPVKINVDWSKFNHIEQPTGMTVYVWPHNVEDEDEHTTFITHNLNSVTLNLEAGLFDAFVFNQSYSEYSTLEFYSLSSFDKAEARVKQSKSSWYSTKEPATKVGEEPEWLAIDCLQDIEVTDDMVKKAEEEYLASMHKTAKTTASQNEVATLVPKSIIKKIDIYIHLDNVPYLRSALGAIENMAEGCYISSKTTTANQVTHTLESWGLIYDKDENGIDNLMKGAIKATVSTFGLPAGHTGAPEENNLFIKLLLVDNETILSQNFPIGDLIADLNSYNGTQTDENGNPIWPEIHIYWPERLPEVEPVGGGEGAFDIGVSDWGDEIVTILPLL